MLRNINKKSFLIIGIISLVFLGCSDKKEEQKEVVVKTSTKAPVIEIVNNENAQEIKVKEKEKSKSKDGSYYLNYGVKSNYDLNAKPANKDASVRVRPRTTLDANMHIRSPYERVQVSLIVTQLSKNFKLRCSACHDDYANGVIGPSLLGKDTNYIYNKIIEFKTGIKSNPLMDDLIKNMSNEDIKEIATEIFNFNTEIQKIGK